MSSDIIQNTLGINNLKTIIKTSNFNPSQI